MPTFYKFDHPQTRITIGSGLNSCMNLGQGGRLVIPAAFRKTMNLKDGEVVMLQMRGNVLQVRTLDETLDAVQARYRDALGPESIVEEFLAERRQEAVREAEA